MQRIPESPGYCPIKPACEVISGHRKFPRYLLVVALVWGCSTAALLAIAGAARGQGANAQTENVNARARITARIEDRLRTQLTGNVHPLARAQNDQGLETPSANMGRITMMFRMTDEQQADLNTLLAQQQAVTSSNFHRWLTPEEYGARFGLAQTDLDKISAWLAARGLRVVETARSRNWIAFTGTASQIQETFGAEIHRYRANGKSFFANASEPTVPSAFAGLVMGFRGLHNYPLSPPSIVVRGIASQQDNTSRPDFTITSAGSVTHFIAPDDFQTIYDLKPLYNAGIDGTGQKIAVVGQTDIVQSDVTKFRSLSGLPASPVQLFLVPGSQDPGMLATDVPEANLDLEWSGATAPHATILYAYSTDVFGSLEYAIDQDLAPVISISYGQCEENSYPTAISQLTQLAQMANSEGITIVSAAGDGGPMECDYETRISPAIEGLTVQFPASLPYVTGVGGTEFSEGNGSYWNASNNGVGGSAISYIPEVIWSEVVESENSSQMTGGGGGASHLFAKPTWQSAPGVPNDSARDVPDISLNAGVRHDPYLICTEVTPSSGSGLTPSCVTGFAFSGGYTVVGGTSAAAPSFAGIVALINQKAGSQGQGNLNYALYPLASTAPSAFHDIIGSGTLLWPCAENCPYPSIFQTAGSGYDLATGLGSIDAYNLVNSWPTAAVPSGTSPALFSISPNTMTAGSPDFTLTATGANFASDSQILWNGSSVGVTMQPGGSATTIIATISKANVAYGTIASVSVGNSSQTGGSSLPQGFTVTGNPPSNDNFAQALTLTSSGSSIVDNSAATTEVTDPSPGCVTNSQNPRTKTVWWSYTASASGTVTFDTIGSPYDTILSVWTGSQGNLSMVGCNDDIAPGFHQSQVVQFVRAGTTYYLMVSPFGPPDVAFSQYGGKTVLNTSALTPATSITVTPATQKVTVGQTAAYQINNVTSQSMNLTCTIPATSLATCSVSSVAANSSTTMTIATRAASSQTAGRLPTDDSPLSGWRALWFVAITLFISFFALQRKVARLRYTGMLFLTIGMAVCLTECGGNQSSTAQQTSSAGGSNTSGSGGTPLGNYEITLTGTPAGGGNTVIVYVFLQVE